MKSVEKHFVVKVKCALGGRRGTVKEKCHRTDYARSWEQLTLHLLLTGTNASTLTKYAVESVSLIPCSVRSL